MPDNNPSSADPKVLLISKYPNRRYYDKTRSRHLTLEEMYDAIRDGYEIQVTDSKTSEDVTARTLAQMILELDPPKLAVFPNALLHRILRSNQQLVVDFTQKYFSQALATFLDSQKKGEQLVRQAMGLHQPQIPTVADWTKMIMSPFNPSAWSPGQPQPTPAPQAAAPGNEDLLNRIAQLQQQIAQMQEKPKSRAKSKPRKAAPKKKKR